MVRCIPGSLALLVLIAPASAEDSDPIRVTIHPASPPTPVLRYRLLPELREQKFEDGSKLYKEADEERRKLFENQDWNRHTTAWAEWTELPAERFPRDAARKALAKLEAVVAKVERAAHSEYCNWDVSERLRTKGIGAPLPEIDQVRDWATVLRLKARLQMLDGDLVGALRTIQTGLSMARQIDQTPTIISHLVACAVAMQLFKQLDEVLSQPSCPNLYWSLTELPQPFLSPRKGLEGERLSAAGSFPGYLKRLNDPNPPPLTEREQEDQVRFALGINEQQSNPLTRYLLAQKIQARHEGSKQALIEAGLAKDKVEKMPHMEVALRHSFLEYDVLFDEMLKVQNFPYWQARALAEDIERKLKARRKKPAADGPALPLAELLLPAVTKIQLGHARVDRKIAALRCVEAIRLYAAKHEGKLPGSLDEIKEAPIPSDPITGKPFEYKRTATGATLTAQPPADRPQPREGLVYELTAAKPKP
jgi:hypothetical protein